MRIANKSDREHVVIDAQTGEILVQRVLKKRKAPPPSYGSEFTIVFTRGVDRLMSDPAMTLLDYRLWWWLTTKRRLSWESYGDVSSTQVAGELGCSQPTASRALARLVAAGLIERQNRGGAGVAARYRLNPYFTWRGTAGQYHDLRQRIGSSIEGRAAKTFRAKPGDPADRE